MCDFCTAFQEPEFLFDFDNYNEYDKFSVYRSTCDWTLESGMLVKNGEYVIVNGGTVYIILPEVYVDIDDGTLSDEELDNRDDEFRKFIQASKEIRHNTYFSENLDWIHAFVVACNNAGYVRFENYGSVNLWLVDYVARKINELKK